MLLCFVIFAAAVSAACKNNENKEIILAKPQGFALRETVLSWEPVEHAGRYELYIENKVYTTEKTEYDLSFLTIPGDYVIQVRAVGEGENIYSSDYSDFTYTIAGIEQEEPTPGLKYTLLPDESGYEVTKDRADISGRVVIPDEWCGLPVTKIADGAFGGWQLKPNRLTQSVRLPKYLKEIGEYAFSYCIALQQISIPSEVSVIGADAFKNCERLTKIELPPSVTTIGALAFFDCLELRTFWMGENVRSIGERAFAGCEKLASICLPYGLEKIEMGTFTACHKLRWLDIPETVNRIEDDFYNVPWVDDQPGDFVYVNSVLVKYRGNAEVLRESDFDPATESIGACAFRNSTVKEVYFPDRIEYMGWGTFFECDTLEKVKLPAMLTFIPENCFYKCKKLTTIEAGENLRTIKNRAFDYTDSLRFLKVWNGVTTIERCGLRGLKNIVLPKSIKKIDHGFLEYTIINLYYEGTEAEWNDFLSVNGDDFLRENVQVYFYNETKPEKNGVYWHWVNGEPVIWEISETGESGSENAA